MSVFARKALEMPPKLLEGLNWLWSEPMVTSWGRCTTHFSLF